MFQLNDLFITRLMRHLLINKHLFVSENVSKIYIAPNSRTITTISFYWFVV